ncbi:MAG: 30S ribosomal protein S17 [Phycisphaerae bacterium]|nr:30S ribosomal protein S17 [Phycisphaerae bacterium]
MEQAQAQTGQDGSRPLRRRRIGVVLSHKRDKTIKVRVEFQTEHPTYGKQIRRRMTIHAHDPQNEAREGDRVQLMACRPISKTKAWRLEKILQAAPRSE